METKNSKGKTAIIDLGIGERGLTRYSSLVADHLPGTDYIRFCSTHSQIEPDSFKGESYAINTYTSVRDVFYKTCFFLPIYLFRFSRLLFRREITSVYFPHFSHWNIFFALVAKCFGVKITYTIHDGKMHFGEVNPVTQFEMNCLIRLATDVIFLSNSVRREISFLKNQRIHLVPLGILDVPGIEELSHIVDRPTILFLGRISKYKGVEMLYEVLKGISPDSYEKVIIAGKANYDIQVPNLDKVDFRNQWLEEKEISELVNGSDIMIFPYIEATQSGALTIAIQGLRPIVCTNVGALTEQVSDKEALIVPPDVAKIREALETLIRESSLREQMRKNLKLKKHELSWPLLSTKIQEIVQA